MARAALLSLAATAALVALPHSALAQAMRIGDLGPMPSRTGCLEAAAKVINTYIAEFGGYAAAGDPADPEAWAIYGWALRPGVIDMVITCPSVAGRINAFFTIHASGEQAEAGADTAAERIRTLWERRN